jgi:Fe-S cluster biogenesis protein NfuA
MANVNSTPASSAAARIDGLLAELGTDPDVLARAEELVRTLVGFYDTGLGRMVEVIRDRPDGGDLLHQIAADHVVGALLVLHDLHPSPTRDRVEAALVQVRPYLGAHAGDVELIGVDDDVVRLRLTGNCDGCPSSSATVTRAIEQAIADFAPEIARVDVDGMVPPPRPVPADPGGRTMLPLLSTPLVGS